ncbi:MAG: hypothetical protein ACXV8L_15050, partial [Ilumatobacteraceae bacterium]
IPTTGRIADVLGRGPGEQFGTIDPVTAVRDGGVSGERRCASEVVCDEPTVVALNRRDSCDQ